MPGFVYGECVVSVLLDGVAKRYPGERAVSDVTLLVEDGTSVVLLGPSGSGKTTLLRLIAGLDQPDSGAILFDGVDVAGVTPARRNLAMFAQDNTLIPRKTGRHNIEFPLRVRKFPKAERIQRVEAEARALGVMTVLERMPSQMSAGQQRLVQLARSMVRAPRLFLIDEPFGGLDASTRRALRAELRTLQQGYGATAVYATHDQEDAMTLADRLVILDQGRTRQIGPPVDVYRRPIDTFVARFVGSPEMALLEGEVSRGRLQVAGFGIGKARQLPTSVLVGVRPEDWEIGQRGLAAEVTSVRDIGPFAMIAAQTKAGEVNLRTDSETRRGDRLLIRPTRYTVFDSKTGRALFHSNP
jgi:multiple sugar transport system ATP-binding protein